jgi:hypothetical protein
MSRRDRKAASDSREFLQAATSAGWVGAYARLTDAQIAELLGCFRDPPSEAGAGLFSTYAPVIFMHAQARQLASHGISAASSKRRYSKSRRNVTTVIRDEVRQLRSQIKAFDKRLGKVSEHAIHAVDRSLGPEERMRFWPPLTEEQGMTALLRRARNALSDLELALSTAGVFVERGRQDDATRVTLEALAHLYIDVAGRHPKRNYDAEETGDFLKLAETFMTMVQDALPAAVGKHINLFPSKIVREVLAGLRS